MSKILYEVYQNDIKDSESVMYGKWYARLKSIETLSIEKLAKHISEHGSVFTADVVEGVMKKFKTCLLEMLLESKKVKIAGLGTFYLTCECQKGGADKESDFNVNQHLKALHIRFLPDQTEEDNLSSREFIKKAEFVNVKSLLSGKDDEEAENGEGARILAATTAATRVVTPAVTMVATPEARTLVTTPATMAVMTTAVKVTRLERTKRELKADV